MVLLVTPSVCHFYLYRDLHHRTPHPFKDGPFRYPMAAGLQMPSYCLTTKTLVYANRVECFHLSKPWSRTKLNCFRARASKQTAEELKAQSSAEDITKKYGLEAGLWKIFSSNEESSEGMKENKSKGDQAKELLAKYGGAYLATSITLSLISFALCYTLISAGVDVAALLQKLGIATNEAGEKVGTFALAYAAHKAASPIRFPPTVALTPMVANWIGSKVDK